jgi:signal transduction histidine kinase
MADRVSRLSVEQRLPLLVGALLLAVMTAIVLGAYTQIRRVAVGTASERLMSVTTQLRDMFQQNAVPLRAASTASASPALEYTGPSKEQIIATQLRDSTGRLLSAVGPWADAFDTAGIDNITAARDSATIGAFRVVRDSIVYPAVAHVRGSNSYVVWWRKVSASRRGREMMTHLIGSDAVLLIGSPATGIWTDLERVVPAPGTANDSRYLAASQPIAGTPWTVALRFPMAPVMAPVQRFMGRMMAFALLALVLGLFGTWLVSHTILRSLESEVRQRTQELGQALTELRDTQESLVRKEKLAMLGQLASGVGHELRNPLGVMTNAIYYLKMVLTPLPERVAEYLGILQQQITLSEKIVNDLLDFARLKQPQRTAASLADITHTQLARLGSTNGVTIDAESVTPAPPVLVDEVQIGQVVLNLLTNAVQAMDGPGRIQIRARAENGHVQYDVADSGPGIPPDLMHKVFEPLFTTKARGIGLGLAVSRTLARANQGDLTVTSTPGEGATFHLTLPVAKGTEAIV